MSFKQLTYLLIAGLCSANIYAASSTPDFWKNATVYFMLTDRFNNGDPSNDTSYNRTEKAGVLRGFEGGDIKGITAKIKEGYFTKLGVDAIWMTPLVEQVHGYDASYTEAGGVTYSYHGYWPKDWTSIDANYGNEADLRKMIVTAREHNIKVLMDVIINHTGPETKEDWVWPSDWIRTQPICQWNSYEQNTKCALAKSLTDIKTESENDVKLPPQLLKKWHKEGRLQQELSELDDFFKRTGYPRAPKYYLVKWLTDWVKEYGIDGFRVDTVKHVEAEVWSVLKKESDIAFNTWKINHPDLVKDDLPFYMVGEVMHWGMNGFKNTVENERTYDFGDKQVDYFEHGFDALINMGFAAHASQSAEQIFSSYSQSLNHGEMKGKGILNYIGSHDDHDSYDRKREKTFEAAFKLMLAPGGVQIYYGDELARPMYAKGAKGDADMRTFMNWEDLDIVATQQLLAHWQKLGQFRREHDAVGTGIHTKLNSSPYIFKRELADKDKVLVAKSLSKGVKTISVYNLFKDGDVIFDYYSNQMSIVKKGKVSIDSEFTYLLIGKHG
jgi:alpha-amylase